MSDVNKFEEYKLFVEDTARFTDRRQTVSNLFVAVNSILLVAIGLIIKDLGVADTWIFLLTLPLVIAGIAVSVWWRQLIYKYKKLVRLRMDTLRAMEELPEMAGSVQMYHAEDKYYPRDEKGKLIPRKGRSFSDLESRLPVLFIVLYALYSGLVLLGPLAPQSLQGWSILLGLS
jgi:hypothetical protein